MMAPFRSNNRGSLVLKRKFPGLRLIRRATGTTKPNMFAAIDRMRTVLGTIYALSDTARYKLAGNGCAAPVVAWLGWQLAQAEPARLEAAA